MPCLMANALGPSNYYSDYTSLSVAYVSSTQISEEEYQHTYHLNNYGDGYIDYINIRVGEEESCDYMLLNSGSISNIFCSALLQPNYGGDISLTSDKPIINPSDIAYAATAYKPGSYYSLNQIKEIKYVGNTNDHFSYKYTYEIEFKRSHYQDALFHFDYGSNDYYVISKNSGTADHYIYTTQELDLEKLSVKDFFFIEPHQAFKIDDDALTRAMWIFLGGLLFISSLIVFPAVFIPAMVRRSRRKKAKATHK